tara:strand:+ start:1458 stop:2042 length:585 start_codon:yes stop_codon:yes gene_type:complete
MNRKTAIQLLLFTSIIVIFLFIFFKYFYQNKKKIESYTENPEILKAEENTSNIIMDVEYLSKDGLGNIYKINANSGKISPDDENLILLEKVKAIIKIIGSEDVVIYSDFAKYNSLNYNTKFYDNIEVMYAEHKIKSEYLDFLFNENLAILYKDIVYTNLKMKLLADKLEFDLITKNSKLSMKDKEEKIEIFYTK